MRTQASNPTRRDLLRGNVRSAAARMHARIGPACLLRRGVVCQTCVDVCDARALRYDMRGGGAGEVRLNQDACTGCGDCLPVCPVGAIALQGGDDA